MWRVAKIPEVYQKRAEEMKICGKSNGKQAGSAESGCTSNIKPSTPSLEPPLRETQRRTEFVHFPK